MRKPKPPLLILIAVSLISVGCQDLLERGQSLPLPLLATPTPIAELPAAPTPEPSPTPTSTPTPVPTPTPAPDERLKEAERLLHNGDYRSAAETYRALLAQPLDEAMHARSQLGLGTAYLRNQSYAEAADTFQELRTDHPDTDLARDAAFLLGEALVGAGDPLAAPHAYSDYLATGTVIAPYVHQAIGDAFRAAGSHSEAIDAYERALPQAPSNAFAIAVRENLALSHSALQNYPAALAQYDAILNLAQGSALRARIGHQTAETLLLTGQTDAGYQRHLTVVQSYPNQAFAHRSLVKLVEAGRPVDDLLRGTVNYYAGVYSMAVEALYRYIRAYPDTHSSAAHWYAGLSFAQLGSPDQAIYEFQLLIDTHPGESYWGEAWLEMAKVHAGQGHTALAVATYRGLHEAAPNHPLAPQALWESAWLLERSGSITPAADAYANCRAAYPASEYAARSLFRAGLLHYEESRLADAAGAWETLTAAYPDSDHAPAALLWLGKLGIAQEDPDGARIPLAQVQEAIPQGYYGLRAAQLAIAPEAAPFPSTGYQPVDAARSRREAESWLANWLGLSADADLETLARALADDPRLQRGRELWRVGRFEEAKAELEALRRETYSDALSQYQLALEFRDIGLYRSSILAAARVIGMSPVTRIVDAPRYILQLAYPTYYEDLVLESAQLTGLDPLLIFSLIRQESLFESLATSIASARGLMQVIPPTGAEIASELNWPPGYETADLYRPYVSLPFGTYYLAKQRDRFDGRVEVALAAYNGGPFNAQRWIDRAGDDPDLFLESITLGEPHLYVRRIREHLAVYRVLYEE